MVPLYRYVENLHENGGRASAGGAKLRPRGPGAGRLAATAAAGPASRPGGVNIRKNGAGGRRLWSRTRCSAMSSHVRATAAEPNPPLLATVTEHCTCHWRGYARNLLPRGLHTTTSSRPRLAADGPRATLREGPRMTTYNTMRHSWSWECPPFGAGRQRPPVIRGEAKGCQDTALLEQRSSQ